MVCRHEADEVVFPDGTRVLASGWFERKDPALFPDFGVYCDPMWTPAWSSVMLEWPDFGVPRSSSIADATIKDAFARAQAGERIEVACVGGHGRTGTVLACMAILAGVPISEAVPWLRSVYCPRAVQEPSQQYWIERFADRI
jgi:Protein-tyrosine phosphatase